MGFCQLLNQKIILLAATFIVLCTAQETVVLNTKTGQIRGRVYARNGKNYGVFLGIPYAEPPVGSNRFKDPIQKKPWSPSVLDASGEYKNRCFQPNPNNAFTDMSEDCLYLNVFTPKASPTKQDAFPVFIFIHQGGFRTGSTNTPINGHVDNFPGNGVTQVTFEYRLGPLGFFTTRSSCGVVGNMGFKDMLLMLKWIKENIAAFGGDPGNIVVMGESAGSIGASLLSLSPLATGLFSKAVFQSNSAFANWVIMRPSKNEKSVRLARTLGCLAPGESFSGNCRRDAQVLTCLQGRGATAVTDALSSEDTDIDVSDIFAGVVGDDFLPQEPVELAKSRPPIDVILGTKRFELKTDEFGIFELGRPKTSSPDQVRQMIPEVVRAFGAKNEDVAVAAAQYKYVDSQLYVPTANEPLFWYNTSTKMKQAAYRMTPVYQDALSLAQAGGNVFLFSYDWVEDDWKETLEKEFNGGNVEPKKSPNDFVVQDLFTILRLDFAKTGTPTPAPVQGAIWEPFDPARGNYLSVDLNKLQMKDGYNWEEVSFWNGLLKSLDKGGAGNCGMENTMAGMLHSMLRIIRSVFRPKSS